MSEAPARLLIVDDEARHVQALCQTLSRCGYHVEGTANPLEALAQLRIRTYDLLLTDLMMPNIDGIELLRQALVIDPNIVGILMTGHGTVDTAVEAMKSGAYDYILKPFNLSVVLPVLRRSLATRRLRIENTTLMTQLKQRALELASANQALQAANRELDSFAHSISHDLRTPLHAVIGFAELMMDERTGPLNDEQRGFLTHVLDGGRHLRDLTENLLRFSRLGRQPLTKEQIDVTTIVEEVVAELKAAEPGRRVEVNVHLLPPALADAALLRQVFANLLSNAFKYTRGVHQPVVDVEGIDEGSSHIYHVRDNGAGFDMKSADQLFTPFKRLHDAEQFEGTGVGLSLAKRIVERHGGYITGKGEPGQGAEFTVTLPA
jgi:signal transduction histidine kinase